MTTATTTASPPVAHGMSATSTRDYLYRALYLRRELLILNMQNSSYGSEAFSNQSVATATTTKTAEPTAASGSPVISLRDILLLPPLYGVDGLTAPPSGSDATTANDPMLTLDHAWRGLVHVRGHASPWYRGCFSFYAYFPSRYPFEPPIIEFTGPLRSHPLVQERRVQQLDQLSSAVDVPSDVSSRVAPQSSAATVASTTTSAVGRRAFVPFDEVYAGLDPMRVSVMAALLQHVLRIFYPTEWTPAMEATALSRKAGQGVSVNRVLARRDVERRSVTQEVMLTRPFEQYVGADVMEHFLQLWDTTGANAAGDITGTVEGGGADWYTREVLPHLLHS
jgi:hypothetical protein